MSAVGWDNCCLVHFTDCYIMPCVCGWVGGGCGVCVCVWVGGGWMWCVCGWVGGGCVCVCVCVDGEEGGRRFLCV